MQTPVTDLKTALAWLFVLAVVNYLLAIALGII